MVRAIDTSPPISPLNLKIITDQLRELEGRLTVNEDKLNAVSRTPADIVPDIVPSLVNFADNTDFIYADEAYNGTAYTDDEDVLAEWYGRTQATASSYTENTSSTESGSSIRRSAHTSGARTGFEWDDSTGSLLITGGYRVATRLQSKFAVAGNYMVVRMQISRKIGASAPATDIICKASIWDNTDNRVIRGTYPVLTSTKIGSHTGGTLTRQYILEVQMSGGRRFYSNTVSFTTGQNQVINAVDFANVDPNNYVTVSWDDIVGAVRYRLYRKQTTGADTNWYLVDTITNGSTSLNDFGGTGGGQWAIPTFDADHLEFHTADAYFTDVGSLIQVENAVDEITMGIRVPYNFSPNGNQFLQIEFLKADYSDTTTTEIPADGVRIDRVGLSYTNGRWAASARDLALTPTPTGNPSPPPSGGGTPDNPPSGGGTPTCVIPETEILMWNDDGINHYTMRADKIVKGDRVVSWDGNKYVPAKVTGIIKGISNSLYWLYADDMELGCSFSHRLISHYKDLISGTRVGLLKDSTLMYRPNKPILSEILTKDIEKITSPVISFNLEKGKRVYIANGFLCHNRKPDPDIGGGSL